MSQAAELQDMLQDFVAETTEMIERISLQLGIVERGEQDAEAIHSIYRDMHSIKGSAQLFGFHQLAQTAHCMEAALDPVRRGSIRLTSDFVDCLYAGLDAIKQLLGDIRQTKKEGDRQGLLLATLPRLVEVLTQFFGQTIHSAQDSAGSEIPAKKPKGKATESRSDSQAATSDGMEGSHDSVRVHVNLLDNLMNLVGELVLIRNQVLQQAREIKNNDNFNKLSQRLSIVTTELQNEVVRTRMQPVSNVLTRFHRVVRDLARDLGKQVDLILEGAETELDKTLIEAIRDPLTHIIRNAVDHGIENSEQRLAASKPAHGTILVRSFHEGGQVIIEVIDDGQGLSRERITNKAIDKGLLTADEIKGMSDREVYQLIFRPGFSTADKISNISGRGVGMDVVRNNIEKIGGAVDLEAIPGQGMSIRLRIPLTLAIVPALVVKAGGERFAIPQVKLVELVRIERNAEGVFSGIEQLQGSPVFRLRGNLLPLITLKDVLALGNTDREEQDVVNIVILNGEQGYFGLFVDEILDSTDIVVKPLGNHLKSLRTYSGATVMGDGSVVLTLDISGLASLVNMFDDMEVKKPSLDAARHQEQTESEFLEYLLIDIGAQGRYGLPLCQVKRLEEFDQKAVQISGQQRVIHYREALLSLIPVAPAINMPYKPSGPDDRLKVIVIERSGRLYGLEVNGILDILATDCAIDASLVDRPGILGSVINNSDVFAIVDVHAILDKVSGRPERKLELVPQDRKTQRSRHHILLVDDTQFYRKLIAQFLQEAGFRISIACDGRDAWEQISRLGSGEFSVVLSDIEMPRMDGLGLAQQVRSSDKYRALPLIALSTKARELDKNEGLRAGFDAYLEKLNKDMLLSELDRTLKLA